MAAGEPWKDEDGVIHYPDKENTSPAVHSNDVFTTKQLADKGLPQDAFFDPTGNKISPTEQYLRDALDLTKSQYSENKLAIEKMIKTGVPAYEIAGAKANWADVFILNNAIREEQKLPAIKPEAFVGGFKSQAAKAHADPRAIQAQTNALKELKGRIDPRLTAKEQAIMEINKRGQEQGLRGQREAALSGARARGFGGSSMAMQSGLAAQQEAAQRGALTDVAAAGMAVDRSENALRDYGSLGGQTRGQSFSESMGRGTAADSAQQFNKGLEQDYQQYKTNTMAQENRDSSARQSALTGQAYAANADSYNRQLEPTRFQERMTNAQVGSNNQGAQAMTSALSTLAGSKQAEEAAALLAKEPEEGILGIPGVPFI